MARVRYPEVICGVDIQNFCPFKCFKWWFCAFEFGSFCSFVLLWCFRSDRAPLVS